MTKSPALRVAGLWSLVIGFWSFLPAAALGHPVPRSEHDRNLTVEWRPEAVHVLYRLEIDEYTLLRDVAKWLADQPGDTRKPIGRNEVASAYMKRMREVIPDQVVGTVDGKDLKFTCADARVEFLDSVQFRFKLKADAPLSPGQHTLSVEDLNFLDKTGRLAMKFEAREPLAVEKLTEPPEARVTEATKDERRTVAATVVMPATTNEAGPLPPAVVAGPGPEGPPGPPDSPAPSFWALLRRVQDQEGLATLLGTDVGLGLVLLIAFLHGALHSLAPGHGKTMVAAYLVGEQGTRKHALLLGLVVTLTHTSAAFGIAVVLAAGRDWLDPARVQFALSLVSGVMVMGIGMWLLMTRLAGKSDHLHLGSHSHAHGHGHAHSHSHGDGHGHSHGLTPEQFGRLGWVRLVLLGISGGAIPCWGAILWVLYCVTAGRYGLALWAVLSFSVGLAVVLILIGLSVVWGGRAGAERYRNRRWFPLVSRWLPVAGAGTVVLIGSWMVKMTLFGAWLVNTNVAK